MKDKQKRAQKNNEKIENCISQVFGLMKRKNSFFSGSTKSEFNHTQIRLLNEIISAKYEGKRLISTQLAGILGITRSAVSQIVNRLEEQGVLKRVADKTDKKIAYIEITDEALEKYGEAMRGNFEFFADVVAEFGKDKFDAMCGLFDEFMEKLEQKKREQNTPNNNKDQ